MYESFVNSLNVGLDALIGAVLCLGVLFIGRAFYRITTKVKLEYEVSERDNFAMGITLAGFLVGLAIAISSGLLAQVPLVDKIENQFIIGLVSMVLLRISLVINDKCILYKFSNLNQIIQYKNVGVALVEAGGSIATGLMIAGAMSCKADSLLEKLHYGAIYWLIGQAILVLAAHVYRLICGFKVDEILEAKTETDVGSVGFFNPIAAGASFGGYLLAIGLIIQASLDGASINLVPEIATIATFAIIGLVLLTVAKFVLQKVLMPTSPIPKEISVDKNVGAGALAAAGYIAIAAIFAASISPATTFAKFNSAINEPIVVTAQETPVNSEVKPVTVQAK